MRKLVPSSDVNSRTGADFMEIGCLLPFLQDPFHYYLQCSDG